VNARINVWIDGEDSPQLRVGEPRCKPELGLSKRLHENQRHVHGVDAEQRLAEPSQKALPIPAEDQSPEARDQPRYRQLANDCIGTPWLKCNFPAQPGCAYVKQKGGRHREVKEITDDKKVRVLPNLLLAAVS
jgi:hypothetical protein